MSGSQPTPAEQHLGDRLAALVDGELGHDARERVLAHIATCPKCKAEADAQRRVKNVFAEAAPPPPSESFLARLAGLPGLPREEDNGFGDGPFDGSAGLGAEGAFRVGSGSPLAYGSTRSPEDMPSGEKHGFRIHEVGRQEAERSASRGRRFAFAAAASVSLAAIALGGVSASAPTAAGDASSGSGSNVTPLRTSGSAAAVAAESGRRRGGATAAPGNRSGTTPLAAPRTTATAGAPLLPGMPAQPAPTREPLNTLPAAPMLAGAALSPLMRMLDPAMYDSEPQLPSLTGNSWMRPTSGARPDAGTPLPGATSSPER